MHERRGTIIAGAGVLLLALLVAGCGGTSELGPTGTVEKTAEKPKAVTAPEQDAKLDEEMGDLGTKARAAGCAFGTLDEEEANHVGEDELTWKTFPPASGRHLDTWAPWGRYTEQVADGFVVHNLEHGGVAVWLGKGVEAGIGDGIEELLDEGEKWLVAPRSDMEGLAAVAWAHGLTCTPAAIDKLGEEQVVDLVDEWFGLVESTGSEAEKDVPAYPGSMAEPEPKVDISVEP